MGTETEPTGKKPMAAPKITTQQFIMSLLVMVLIVVVVLILAFVEVPKENKDMFNFVLGNITGTLLGSMAVHMWPVKKHHGENE